MTGKPAPSSNETKELRPRHAPVAAVAPAARTDAELLAGLERLRDGLYQRLEQIESLAAEQAQLLEQEVSEREQYLGDRVTALEATQARLQAEARRREQELQTVLQDVDDDRRRLADSWERLEREQLDATPVTCTPAAAPASTAPPDRQAPAHRLPVDDPADDAVTRTILRQFQTLKNDVRRNAKERNGH